MSQASRYYPQAKREIERRRQKAETQFLARREQVYAALPDLLLLDEKLASAGALAARLAADGSKQESRQALQQVHEIGKRKELLLSQGGFTSADLSPKYTCIECRDTGYQGHKPCACLMEEVKRLRRLEVNAAGPLRLSDFSNFSLDVYPESMEGSDVSPRQVMSQILRDAKDYATGFGLFSESLFLFGSAGLGKTHLALSIASQVLDRGFDVIYVSAQSAFSEISAARFSAPSPLFASMLQADLLVLDDLGTEYLDSYILSRLYELVNHRMKHRPTIYTTNICRQDLLNQRYTEKIASRLLGECHLMRFVGSDIRLTGGR